MKPQSSLWLCVATLCLLFPLSALAANAPTNLVVTSISNSQLNLAWTDNANDETGYTFMVDTNSSFTNPTYVYAGGVNTTSYSHTGRSTATTYFYKIKAEGNPDSTWTAISSGTTAPASLGASPVSSSQINLSWSGNGANGNIVGYTYAWATNSSFSGATYTYVNGASTTSASHTGLSAGTTYYYKLKAEGTTNAYDSGYTAVANATTNGSAPASAVPISPYFAGNNAWMPHQIGTHVFYGSLTTNPNDTIWTNIDNSGVAIMRYGGHGVDEYANAIYSETLDQYVDMVDAMRAKGIEPVLQVPVLGTTYNASHAADIVRHVNFVNGVRQSRAVTYWIIGNEPNLQNAGYGTNGYTVSQIATYLKSFSSAMKAVDPAIKIIGPETAWYDPAILEGLTTYNGTNDITGTDSNGRYYVDYLSFHYYPFDGTQGSPDRPEILGKLLEAYGFDARLAELKARLASCNTSRGRTGSNALKMAVTEANINYTNNSTDDLYGYGTKSFLGGQFWAEMMGIAMQRGVDFVTFWSTIEGSNGTSYISSDGATKYPAYYHFQMMAQNFRGSSVAASDTQASVKTFGSIASDQIAVMIMNQHQSSSFDYTVRLNTGTVSGTRPLKISVDAGVAVESNGTIATESSIVLIFNTAGTLTKKIEYKLYGNANSGAAPTVTNY